MITIEPLTTNPFINNPELLKIWPEKSSKIVHEITLETLEKNEPGIFLIKKEEQIIGLTGYFLMDETMENIGLRWHGIVQSQRRKGYSEAAMTLVMQEVKSLYPQSSYLVEYVPVTDYSSYIVKHFVSLGFKRFVDPGPQDWTDNMIQGYRVDMNEFLLKHTIDQPKKLKI